MLLTEKHTGLIIFLLIYCLVPDIEHVTGNVSLMFTDDILASHVE